MIELHCFLFRFFLQCSFESIIFYLMMIMFLCVKVNDNYPKNIWFLFFFCFVPIFCTGSTWMYQKINQNSSDDDDDSIINCFSLHSASKWSINIDCIEFNWFKLSLGTNILMKMNVMFFMAGNHQKFHFLLLIRKFFQLFQFLINKRNVLWLLVNIFSWI